MEPTTDSPTWTVTLSPSAEAFNAAADARIAAKRSAAGRKAAATRRANREAAARTRTMEHTAAVIAANPNGARIMATPPAAPARPPLSIPEVLALAKIIDAAEHGAYVRRLVDDRLVEGVARCITGQPGGGFLHADQDIRDGFLHVSALGEFWWPIGELVESIGVGEFAVDSK
jgi:hypothetical protein